MDSQKEFDSALTPKQLTEISVSGWTIPIYQRLFVWEEEQIQQLLNDLHRAASGDSKVPYYIGILTVVDSLGKDAGEWTVVDGQQRLTFLSLFAAWCIQAKIHEEEWRRFLYKTEDRNGFRISYFGREADKNDLASIVGGQLDKVQNPRFRVFCACMEKMRKSHSDKFAEFSLYVFEHTSFLVSKLPGNYDAVELNRFFEKLNATGRQLSAVDQIRGRYFASKADVFDRCLNFERKYRATQSNDKIAEDKVGNGVIDLLLSTAKIEDKKENAPMEETGARSILSPETMLLHVLSLMPDDGKDVLHDSHRILETFKQTSFCPDAFLDNLEEYRCWLDEHVIYVDSSNENSAKYRIRNTAAEAPSQKTDQDDSEQKSLRKLIGYQSMLYVASDNWQGWVLDFYRRCRDSQSLNASAELKILKEREREKHPLPPLEDLRYGQGDCRYWFWALDYLLWEKAMEGTPIGQSNLQATDIEAIKAYQFRRNRSIEHLHPQNPQKESPEWQKDRDENNDRERDGFGNLAMISSSFNSSQGNDSVGVKFARVKDVQLPTKSLQSIKMLLMFRAAKESDENWTPEKAKEHGEAMYSLLKENYRLLKANGVEPGEPANETEAASRV